MTDYGHRTAYLLVFLLPDKTYAKAGIYSEFPAESTGNGMWVSIDRTRGRNYSEAYQKMLERWETHYEWLKADK